MEIKHIFSDYRNLAFLAELIMYKESELEPSSPKYSHTPKSKSKYFKNYSIENLDEMQKEYEKAINDFNSYTKSLPASQRIVMHLRYVEGLKWYEVADVSHFSQGHCERINTEVLRGLGFIK